MDKKNSGFVCVICGENATKGSMKHPYCEECFTEVWEDDYDKYTVWLTHSHI